MGSPFRNVQKNKQYSKRLMKFEKANRERYEKMTQKTKDSLQAEAWKYGDPFWSPKHQVNVDPEDGVLYNRPIYKDGSMLTYPSLSKPTLRKTKINKSPTNKLSTKKERDARKKSFKDGLRKTAWDIGSTFLKGAPGVAATFLTPQKTYAHQDGEWVNNPDGSKNWKKFEFIDDNNDGGLLPKFEEETPLNKSNEPRKTTKGKGRNFRTTEEGAGMTEKGVKEYKKKNPGSNLQTAVTEKNPKGKRAARRKSFCARSRGWTGERGRAARRRWNC